MVVSVLFKAVQIIAFIAILFVVLVKIFVLICKSGEYPGLPDDNGEEEKANENKNFSS